MRTKIKHIERWKDRHGKLRFYYRVGKGDRTPLRGPEGSPDFWADYHAAANGEVTPKPTLNHAGAGSMRWLIEQYYGSSEFKTLKDRTKRVRRGILDKFCGVHGHKPYATLKTRNLKRIRDGMFDRPEAANGMVKALRQVFNVALDDGYVDENPAASVKKLPPKNKNGFHAWTLKEIKTFEDTHPVGTKARLAMSLLIYTAQRRGDVVRMGAKDVENGWIKVVQEKGGKELDLPILKELKRIINASPIGQETYLETAQGKPFTSNGFGNWFRDQCDEAKLPQCSAHGLRKASAARLAELGCSVHEIMSITGHDSVSEVQRYTKAASQRRRAARVRDRVDG